MCFKCDGTGMIPAKITTLATIKREAQSRVMEQRQVDARSSKGTNRPVASKRKRTIASKRKPSPKKSPKHFTCPECGVVAPTQLVLDVHLQRVHKPSEPHFRVGRKRSLDPSVAPEATVLDRSKSLDATREWSSSYRDRGQFGSHASFDAMDDNSEP